MAQSANAANPICNSGSEGTIAYDGDRKVMVYCDGDGWKMLGASFGAGGSLPSLDSARIWVGNGSNAATAVSMSGDATLSNAGVLTIGNGAITTGKIADSSVTGVKIAANSIDGTRLGSNAVTTAKVANGTVTVAKIAASGTASASTFLRGDGSWESVPAGADNLGDHIATTVLRSDTHNTDDLGTTAIRWKDGWFAGAVTAGTFAGSGASLTALNATNLGTGTVPAARMPALSGDVTTSAGATATTIANNAVTAAKTNFIGTLTEGKWCTVSSGKIVCTSDAPGGGGITAVTTVSCSLSSSTSCSATCGAGYFRTGCGTNKSTSWSYPNGSNGCAGGRPSSDNSGPTAFAICSK